MLESCYFLELCEVPRVSVYCVRSHLVLWEQEESLVHDQLTRRVVKCRQKTTTKRRGRSGEEKEVLSGELITSRWINDSDISNKSCQTLTPEPAPLPLSLSPSLSPFFPFMLSLFCPLILYTLSSRPSECGRVLPFISGVSFPGQTVQINNVNKLSSNSSSLEVLRIYNISYYFLDSLQVTYFQP